MGDQKRSGKYDQIVKAAREAAQQLKSDGHAMHAASVQSLIMARIISANTSRGHYETTLRMRTLLRRAHDATSRREPDGISDAEWDQLVADMAKELGVAGDG